MIEPGCQFPTQATCYGSGVQFATSSYGLGQTGPRINGAFGSLIQAYNTGASTYNSLQVAPQPPVRATTLSVSSTTLGLSALTTDLLPHPSRNSPNWSSIVTTKGMPTGTAPSTSATTSARMSFTPCLSRGTGSSRDGRSRHIVGIHTGSAVERLQQQPHFNRSRVLGEPMGFTSKLHVRTRLHSKPPPQEEDSTQRPSSGSIPHAMKRRLRGSWGTSSEIVCPVPVRSARTFRSPRTRRSRRG